jgi:hypothetical protein
MGPFNCLFTSTRLTGSSSTNKKLEGYSITLEIIRRKQGMCTLVAFLLRLTTSIGVIQVRNYALSGPGLE